MDKYGNSPHAIAEVDLDGRWVVVDVGNNIDFSTYKIDINEDDIIYNPAEGCADIGFVSNILPWKMPTREDIRKDFTIVTDNPRIKELAKENPCFADEEYLKMYIYPAKIVNIWIGKK